MASVMPGAEAPCGAMGSFDPAVALLGAVEETHSAADEDVDPPVAADLVDVAPGLQRRTGRTLADEADVPGLQLRAGRTLTCRVVGLCEVEKFHDPLPR
jgi:hypothetical protein